MLLIAMAMGGAPSGCGGRSPTGAEGLLQIAAVGDSITQGAHSTGGNATWPGQLQLMLEARAPGRYCVTNLGEGGATLQQRPHGDSPYWERGSFQKLTAGRWDTVVVMLGTNDAKDACGQPASFCNANVKPPGNSCCNWPHASQTNWTQDCGGMDCPYVLDYAKLIGVIRRLGRKDGAPPDIWLAIPPPLMNGGSAAAPAKPYGMNQTVINDILPSLIPRIASANRIPNPAIDVFSAMGGTAGLDCGDGAAVRTPYLCNHACVASPHASGCSDQVRTHRLACTCAGCRPCSRYLSATPNRATPAVRARHCRHLARHELTAAPGPADPNDSGYSGWPARQRNASGALTH